MRRDVLKILLTAAALALAPGLAAAAGAHPLQGRPAPDFALRSTAGTNYRLSEYRGEVVLLTFWGSRCGQCVSQLAAIDELRRTYASAGLMTLGVNVDDDQAAAREFAAARGVGFPLLMDPEKAVARAYRVDALPLVVLVDRGGTVRAIFRDYRSGADAGYQTNIKALLDE
jgi:peroxiredoxin